MAKHRLPLAALLLTTFSVLAADNAQLLQPVFRFRYERTEAGALITGHGTAFGVDLSAFGIAGKKYLLSAAHNALDDKGNPYKSLKVELSAGARTVWVPCAVIATDPALDLCLLEASEPLPALATLATADADTGSALALAGSPRGVPVALFKGTLARRFENGTVRSLAQVAFDHGDSGGPVYDAAGKVIGVAVAGVPKNGDIDRTVGLFVPGSGISSFLETHCAPKLKPAVAAAKPKRAPVIDDPGPAAPIAMSVPVQRPGAAPAEAKPAMAPASIKAPVVAPPVVAEPRAEVTELKLEKPVIYVVQDGDYLGKIAKKHNSSIKAILAANDLADPDRITVGMKLVIP